MKTISCSFIRKLLFDKSGQSMVWVAVSFTALLGMAGLTLDVGHAYVVRSQLQSVVNAAALAGVSGLTTSASQAQINAYTVEANSNQPSWGFPASAASYPTANAPAPIVKCLNALMPTTTVTCSTSNILNSVQVTEIVNVPTYFIRVLNLLTHSSNKYLTLPVSATATAAPAEARPWIVEIVLDTTGSMTVTDDNCAGKVTSEKCALIGIQGMLAKLNPCPPGTTNCDATNANIRFGLMTFPNIITTEASYNYGSSCSNRTVHSQPYSTPAIPSATFTTVKGHTYPTEVTPTSGSGAFYSDITYTTPTIKWQNPTSTTTSTLDLTYQPTFGASDMDGNGFYVNYYSATDKSGLNPSSTLVQAIGRSADSVNQCLQVPSTPNPVAPNNGGTAFAPVLYAAETAVLAEQKAHPTVNNLYTQTAIVFLSDGQANALSTMFPPPGTAVTAGGMRDSSGNSVMNGILQGTGSGSSPYKPPTPSPLSLLGTYPSGFDACQQAIAAAQYAAEQGTRVYTVAYGAETSGCLFYGNSNGTTGPPTSSSYGGGGSDVNPLISFTSTLAYPFGSITDVVPCNTIMNMASDMQYFYSDQEKSSSGSTVDTYCTSPDHPSITSLNDIFLHIYGSLTGARLIPNGTT